MSSILKHDAERSQAEQAVNFIYHNILRDYIAEANRREVMSNLYNFFKNGDIAIISKPQLKVYQELEKLAVDSSLMTTNKGLFPNG